MTKYDAILRPDAGRSHRGDFQYSSEGPAVDGVFSFEVVAPCDGDPPCCCAAEAKHLLYGRSCKGNIHFIYSWIFRDRMKGVVIFTCLLFRGDHLCLE